MLQDPDAELLCCNCQPFFRPASLGIGLDASVKGGDGGHRSRVGPLLLAQSVKAVVRLPCLLGSREGSGDCVRWMLLLLSQVFLP